MRKPTVVERRNEILEAACQVVVDRGFAATRISDVADRLGVSTGLIHYHFESKDQLLTEAVAYAAREDLARLQAELERAATPLAKLDRAFRLYSTVEHELGWMLWIDGWGEAIRSPDIRRISQDLDLRWKQTLEQIIGDGVATGEFRCADPSASAWRLAALLDGLGVQLTVHDGVITKTQLVAWVRTAACAELGLPVDAFARRRPARGATAKPDSTAPPA